MDCDGRLRTCSRTENNDLFRLAIGGYGLFGIVTRVCLLKLMPRTKIERMVEIVDIDDLMPAFAARIAARRLPVFDRRHLGHLPAQRRVLLPSPAAARCTDAGGTKGIGRGAVARTLLLLPCRYAAGLRGLYFLYLFTSGQRYWSDTSQLGVYIDDYHAELDRRLGSLRQGTEMITELYVSRSALPSFLAAVRADFRRHGLQLIYGTIRLIERDDESVWPGRARPGPAR